MDDQPDRSAPPEMSSPIGLVIHSTVDDYGLPLSQFRILCHIARRGKGGCWSSLDSIAGVCRIHRDTVIDSLRVLLDRGLVVKESCPGRTNIYRVRPVSEWPPPIGNEGAPESKGHPSKAGDTHRKARGTHPRESKGRHPTETKGHEGSTIEGLPSEGNPIEGVPQCPSLKDQALEVYGLYPKKVAREIALQKIKKAIGKHGFETVKAATAGFASAWAGAKGDELQFCPHPATWFGQERFLDMPETWRVWNKIKNEKPNHGRAEGW